MNTLEEHLPNENCVMLGYTVSIKYLTEDGEVNLINTASHDLAPWESLGMLISHCDDVRHLLREGSEG